MENLKKRNNRLSKQRLYAFTQGLLFRIKSFNQLFILIAAVLIGVMTGLLAVAFRSLITF